MPRSKDTDDRPVETDLKENLQLSRSALRTILDLSENIIIILDKNGIIIDASSKIENLFGVSLSDILGKASWEDFVPDDDLDRLKGYFSDRAKGIGNPPSTYTLRICVPGEESRFMRASTGFIPGTENRVVILKDLSEVVEEQRRTAESDERYRTVVENINDGVLICNEDRIFFVNNSFCNMTNLEREEVYTFPPKRLFHESDRDKFETIFRKSQMGIKETVVFETGIVRKNGFLPAELSSTPIVYRETKAVIISVRDLSQRREAERKFKESNLLMKAVVDNSPVGVSVHDRNGTLLIANDSWMAIWGKSPEDLSEKMVPRKELLMDDKDSYLGKHTDDVEKVYRNGGELYIPKLKLANPSPGGAEYISHHFYALMDDNGEVDKVVILTLDLTEPLRTKNELEETRDQYHELFSNIPVAVFRTTLEFGGRIVSANPEMYRMFLGEGSGDLSKTTVQDLYVDSSRRDELKQKLQEKDEVRGFKAELKRLDGSTFQASISARKITGSKGRKSHIEGIIRDITNQRRVMEELQRMEHLESIGTLAGGVAHDFNNLLMAIQGNVSLAREEEDPIEISEHLNEADASIEEASTLARQLLTFAKGGDPVKKTLDIASFIRESALFSLRGSDVEAEFNLIDDIHRIEADREQISQVIRNLVLNSIQAMPDGGTITISCSNAEIEHDTDTQLSSGEYVKISIKDTGSGIPPDDLRRIFNPYFSTKPDGSGLGLSTSHSIVTRHSGAIRVFSEVGEGTEFEIYLPVKHSVKQNSHISTVPDKKKAVPQAHVLIMDDDPTIRKVLSGMLKVLGHEVTESADGAEALELYRKKKSSGKPFDLVIMDLTIPGGMGGEVAIRQLREIDPDVKAIVSSGYATNSVLSNHSEYGFSGKLVKPFRISTLKTEIKSVLSG